MSTSKKKRTSHYNDLDILSEEQIKKIKKSTSKFINTLSDSVNELNVDIKATKDRDPAARSSLEVLLLYPGIHALTAHRIANRFHKNGNYFTARAISPPTTASMIMFTQLAASHSTIQNTFNSLLLRQCTSWQV